MENALNFGSYRREFRLLTNARALESFIYADPNGLMRKSWLKFVQPVDYLRISVFVAK